MCSGKATSLVKITKIINIMSFSVYAKKALLGSICDGIAPHTHNTKPIRAQKKSNNVPSLIQTFYKVKINCTVTNKFTYTLENFSSFSIFLLDV